MGKVTDLGRNLRRLRVARGINQKELSLRSGLSEATISRVEAGHVRQVRSASLQALARTLQVSVDDLVAAPAAAEKQQLQRWLEEGVAALREGSLGLVSLDPGAALAQVTENLVSRGILRRAALYRVDGDHERLSLAGWATEDGGDPEVDLPESMPLQAEHAAAAAARRGTPRTAVHRGPGAAASQFFQPVSRAGATGAVLVTWSPRNRRDDTRLRLQACAPLLDDLALILGVAGQLESGRVDGATPWTRGAADPVAVVVDGRVVDVDDGLCRLAGLDRSDLIGMETRRLLSHAAEAESQPAEAPEAPEEALLHCAGGRVLPVAVSASSRRLGPRPVQVLVVRDDRRRRHAGAIDGIERSFLDAAPDNLEPVLQSCFSELTALGIDLRGVGINLLDPGEKSFVAHTLLAPARVYVDELRQGATDDYDEWLAHWRRRQTWVRPFVSSRVRDYHPSELIDVPIREGTLAVGIGRPSQSYPSIFTLLGTAAATVSASLRRMRRTSGGTDRLLRASWDATEAPAVLLDSRGVVRDCNAAWALAGRALGMPEGGLLGVSLVRMCDDGGTVCHQRLRDLLEQILTGGRVEAEDRRDCVPDCPLAGRTSSHCRLRAVRLDAGARDDNRFVLLSSHHSGTP